MFYLFAALLSAVMGALPLLLRRKIRLAVWQSIAAAVVGYGVMYLVNPSTVWPLFGVPGLLAAIGWLIAAFIDGITEDEIPRTLYFPLGALCAYIVVGLSGAEIFRASEYAAMLGTVEESIWTQDVQPKDPRHMRMSTTENAIYQAKKILGAAGAIGSQFVVSDEHMTLQMINGELWYVVSLDFSDFGVWMNSEGSPGYIKVHGEDPHRQPELVMLRKGERMQYTPGAFFSRNLERHLRNSGYRAKGLSDWTFEIDEEGKPWWVVTVYKPTIAWWGEKVLGVATVDPINGGAIFHPMGKIPDWVDRAIPHWVIEKYLSWHGELSGGWVNSWWGKHGLTKPEPADLIYGMGNQPEWVVGVTSRSEKDDSLVGLVYTNSRTGKSVRYSMGGGATNFAILDAVNKNQQVQFRHLHAVAPQLYNVYGVPTSVVPLLNDSHAFQGIAMVPINDIQMVAVGSHQYETLRTYEKLLAEGGQRIAVEKERNLRVVEGVVDRFNSEVVNTGSVYYLHIRGVSHLFTAGAGESPKLPVTKEGDSVKVEYYASDRDVVPMHKFDNLALQLSASKAQAEVRKKVEERREVQETREDASTALERLKKMDPKELQKLGRQLPPSR